MRRAITSVLIAILLLGCLAVINGAMGARSAYGGSPAPDALFSALPDTDAVAIVNVSQLHRQLQSLVSTKPNAAAELQKQLDRLLSDTGIDIRSVDTAVIGFSLEPSRRIEPLILASGRFNEAQVLESVSRSSKKQLTTETYKGARIHTEGAAKGERPVLAFLDENTAVFGSLQSVRMSVDARSGAHPSAAQNSSLMSALGQANAAASIRFAVTIPDALRQRLASDGELGGMLKPLASVNQAYGSVDLGDNGLLANISLQTPSEKEAGEVVSLINNGLAFIRLAIGTSPEGQKLSSILNGVTNTQAGNTANLIITIPAGVLNDLLDHIQPKTSKT